MLMSTSDLPFNYPSWTSLRQIQFLPSPIQLNTKNHANNVKLCLLIATMKGNHTLTLEFSFFTLDYTYCITISCSYCAMISS